MFSIYNNKTTQVKEINRINETVYDNDICKTMYVYLYVQSWYDNWNIKINQHQDVMHRVLMLVIDVCVDSR